MKFVLALVTLGLTSVAYAGADAPRFSAFSQGDDLFVTVLGDSCNSFAGSLVVEETCKEDRVLKNLAPVCGAELQVMSTQMACNDKRPVARVVTMSLGAENVAKESDMLVLTYGGQKIEVELNR